MTSVRRVVAIPQFLSIDIDTGGPPRLWLFQADVRKFTIRPTRLSGESSGLCRVLDPSLLHISLVRLSSLLAIKGIGTITRATRAFIATSVITCGLCDH